MIRPIDIRLNAAHPELPLVEATTFTGAPSSVFIRGVPRAVGNWSITAVNVAVTYPDNSTTTRAAVQSAENVWVATIPGTATSGRTEAGFRVLADGIDENGAAVTGYVLGFADFSVMSFTAVPAPGETFYILRYFDAIPTTPKKGDVALVNGVLKYYNGTAWEPFAAPITFDDAVTRDSTNGVKSSGIWAAIWGALTALPTDFSSLYDWCVSQLAGKASTADATLTARYGSTEAAQWTITYPQGWAHGTVYITWFDEFSPIGWVADCDGNRFGPFSDNPNATTLTGEVFGETITATRTALPGYQLGSDDQHILASEAEAEALRTAVTGKQDALSAQQLANIAAVPNKANTSDVDVALSQKQDRYTAWTVTKAVPEAPDATVEWVDGEWKFTYDGVVIGSTDNQNLAATSIEDLVGTYSATRAVIIDGKANRAANPTAGNLAALDAQGNPTDSLIPAANVALKADLRYSYNAATVTLSTTTDTDDTATATNVADRAINTATLGSTVTAATVTLPAAVANRSRDFFLDLTIEATTAPTLTFIDPATSTTADVKFGADSLADIAPGYNLVLFTELPSNRWLVSVKHEEAA